MRLLVPIAMIFLFIGCGKKDSPKSPEQASLVFPERNSECTTGQSLSETTSRVEFLWQPSDHTESYELRVTNLNTGTTQTAFVETPSASVTIAKGVPYSWVVVSKNSGSPNTAISEEWRFYNAGSQTNYAPFPAEIVEPQMAANVFKDINNEVTLSWVGADVDNDISSYEVYFSTETPPETLIASPATGDMEVTVSVSSNGIYYWQVVTKDEAGNSSDSGIFDFKVF